MVKVSAKQQIKDLTAEVESLKNLAQRNSDSYGELYKRYTANLDGNVKRREQDVIDACTKVAEVISGKRVKNFNIIFY